MDVLQDEVRKLKDQLRAEENRADTLEREKKQLEHKVDVLEGEKCACFVLAVLSTLNLLHFYVQMAILSFLFLSPLSLSLSLSFS